jgi:hypothetical protein
LLPVVAAAAAAAVLLKMVMGTAAAAAVGSCWLHLRLKLIPTLLDVWCQKPGCLWAVPLAQLTQQQQQQ